MFTKLDMIDTQVVLMNSVELCHDDVTADQFLLELVYFELVGTITFNKFASNVHQT